MLIRIKEKAQKLAESHGIEVSQVAQTFTRTLIPGASKLVYSIQSLFESLHAVSQDDIHASLEEIKRTLGQDVDRLDQLIDYLMGPLNRLVTELSEMTELGMPVQVIEARVNTELDHNFSWIRDEFRALMPSFETVQQQCVLMLTSQGFQGVELQQTQDLLAKVLSLNTPLSTEGVTGPQVHVFLRARGRFQEAILDGDFANASVALAQIHRLSPHGETYLVCEKALHAINLQHQPGDVVSSWVKGLTINMVYCPSGELLMGLFSRHHVKIDRPFLMGQVPVTQLQWKTIMRSNPSYFKGAELPVEMVSWYDCIRFCNALSEADCLEPVYHIGNENRLSVDADLSCNGYRLPTEAEWEYAAKSGIMGMRYSGSNHIDDVAWYAGNTDHQGTRPVGQKNPNLWNIYDLSGNVWEWCCDDWTEEENQVRLEHIETEVDPIKYHPDAEWSVRRGGSWTSHIDRCRIGFRLKFTREQRYYGLGFRLVRSL